MIGALRGLLLEKHPPHLLLEAQGVAYELEAPLNVFDQLPATGAEVRLYTHLVVRQDALRLYAFSTASQLRSFRELIRLSGVGPRLALAILSGMDERGLAECVRAGDAQRLARLPGIGRKIAQRILMELRDRLPEETPPGDSGPAAENPRADAVSALIGLGYRPEDARRAVEAAYRPELNSGQLIRATLQRMLR